MTISEKITRINHVAEYMLAISPVETGKRTRVLLDVFRMCRTEGDVKNAYALIYSESLQRHRFIGELAAYLHTMFDWA